MMIRSLLIDHCNSFKVSRSPLILKLCLVRDNFILEAAFYFEEAFESFFWKACEKSLIFFEYSKEKEAFKSLFKIKSHF